MRGLQIPCLTGETLHGIRPIGDTLASHMSTASDWLNEERQELAIERILEGAREVFARDGIRGARMGKIAEAAGCARATLYRYFPNKEAVLHAYMVRVAADFREVLDDRLRNLKSLDDRFVEAVAVSVELIRERDDVAPFFSEEGLGLTWQLASGAAAMREELVDRIERGDEIKFAK